ncbi:MAG: hypothetical protein VB020_04650 [Methanocorpusculum sp.]|nr:hypothetical protein [Methanocorpusculum sp.]
MSQYLAVLKNFIGIDISFKETCRFVGFAFHRKFFLGYVIWFFFLIMYHYCEWKNRRGHGSERGGTNVRGDREGLIEGRIIKRGEK